MAGVTLRDGDLAKAESQFQKANSLIAKFQKSAKRKGSLQFRLQAGLAALAEARHDWPGAQKAFEEVLKQDPKNAAAMQRLAYCLFQQKNPDGAVAKLRDAAKANPAMLTPEAIMAQFCQRSGDVANAKKWMAAALAAAPKNLKTRLAVGQCALELGLMDEAQKHAVAAMQIDKKSLEAEFFRGLVALCQKDYHTAESYFESALQRAAPGSAFPISNNLALALIEQEDEASGRRALEYAEANAKQFPKSANANSTYGWVLYRLGRLDDAEKALHAAAAAGPLSIDTAYFTARVLVDRKRKDEAKQTLETALEEHRAGHVPRRCRRTAGRVEEVSRVLLQEPYCQSLYSCTNPAFTGLSRMYLTIFSSSSSERDQ